MRFSTILFLSILILSNPAATAWSEPMDHVILVSVDGLRADLLEELLAADTAGDYATFQRLVDEGASTFNARTDYTHTVTLPNHTCMITGRPVLQPFGQPVTVHHGYTSNSDPWPGDTLHNRGNVAVPYIASVFDVAHDNGLTTALYASKSKFIIFDQSYDAAAGAPDLTGADDGPDKIDVYYEFSDGYPANAAGLHTAFMADFTVGPADFTFVHYRDLDSVGHASGWGSPLWDRAVQDVDGYLGDILDFVDANPGMMGRTVIIVTADHGGLHTGHSTSTDPETFTIPFFVWGTEVAVGADLYHLNPRNRLDPGTGQLDYNAAVAPIRNGDSGNLALGLLELPTIPGSTINADQDLNVALPASAAREPATGPAVALQAYPNPFNARTVLSYELERAENVRIAVHDLSGRRVRVLEDAHRIPGRYEVSWDGRDDSGRGVASGVYYYVLDAGGVRETKKLTLVK